MVDLKGPLRGLPGRSVNLAGQARGTALLEPEMGRAVRVDVTKHSGSQADGRA